MPAYKDEKSGTWYAKFRYKDWDEKTRNKMKRGFKTKREAVQWENNFKANKAGDNEMLFEAFVDTYIEERFPRLKPSTRAMKENIIRTKIIPYFGKKKLSEISTTDIIKWQNMWMTYCDPDTGKPFAKSYLKTIHNQLNAILNYACRFYKLRCNPASIVGNMGDESEVETNFWTLDEYLRFSEEMMDEPTMYYAFQTLYWLGIREGEMLALRKADFNFTKKIVSITKTYQVINGKALITTPKTRQSNREVSIPDFLCEELKDYFEMIPHIGEKERIFFTITKSSLHRHIRKGAMEAGLKEIRVHDLRHSHVSLLISMGYSAVEIAKRMGHKSIHVTYRYAHMFPTVQKDMVNELNKLMEAAENERQGL